MSSSNIRVRIAPSPTGYLHVGTARTAIFNYLFARHEGGKFLIRIEDTDVERNDNSLIEPILSALKWLGIESDEPVVYQSARLSLYKEQVKILLENGHGYRCFCAPSDLEAEREKARAEKRPPRYSRKCLGLSQADVDQRVKAGQPFAVRLRIPEGEIVFNDMVSGEIRIKNEDIEDLVVARSDGSATYNFAVVIDDHDMGITHVIRGNDHISNTFKQIHLYQALGFPVPRFGHVPLILRPDKKKVSKRLGDKDVAQYQHDGILPEAMFNFLSLLGWSTKTEQEIFTRRQLIEIFDAAHLNPSNAVFDEEKLISFNKAHIQMMSDHDLAVLVAPMLVEAGVTTKYWLETRWDYLRQVVGLLKERTRRVTDFVTLGGYFFSQDFTYDPEAMAKHFDAESAELLSALADRFAALSEFTHQSAEQALEGLAAERQVKKARIIHPVRLAVSGMTVGPGLYDTLVVLTRPIVLDRLKKAVEYIRTRPQI
ncbi:MAG: glutamate--tRNA ligase [candidate division Zixibacteria bacterium]|nr:glutamate--tRNA ligase [candidate division Zixibacteria bacterium]